MPIGKIISIVICVAVIVVVALSCSRDPNDNPPTTLRHQTPDDIADVSEFSFSTGGGMRKYSGYDFAAKTVGDKALVTVRPNDEPEENTVEFETDLEIMKELRTIIIDYDLLRWDGFDKSNKHVLDGKSFSMKLKLSDGTEARAHGYHSWPKNFSAAEEKIERVFMQAYEKRTAQK